MYVDHLTRLQFQQETLQACWEEVKGVKQFLRGHQIGMLGIKSELDMYMELGTHQNTSIVLSSKIGWFQNPKNLVTAIF